MVHGEGTAFVDGEARAWSTNLEFTLIRAYCSFQELLYLWIDIAIRVPSKGGDDLLPMEGKCLKGSHDETPIFVDSILLIW